MGEGAVRAWVRGWHTFSSPSNTGDGIELAKQAGAMTLLKGGLSQIHLVGREPLPLNDELSALRMVNTGVFVTDLGYVVRTSL